MKNNYKKIIFSILLLISLMGVVNVAFAQVDTFGGQQENVNSALGLGDNDPRVVAANVIRVLLGFLGILAISIIIYAGWLWMTADGSGEQIEKAKKILINAVIGLLIILSAFAITTFILGKIMDVTGTTSGSNNPDNPYIPGGGGCEPVNSTRSCGCDGTGVSTCTAEGSWSACTGEICGGDLGASCNSTTTPGVCIQDSAKCNSNLTCDAVSCTCVGAPLIQAISPVDQAGIPNGAVGNFITITGKYFGTSTGAVFFSNSAGITDVKAIMPNQVNPKCMNSWSVDQIIVAIPAGANTGAIRVVRADGKEDTTDNSRGNKVPITNGKFEINTLKRPGLCKVDPEYGKINNKFYLHGNAMAGTARTVKFGNDIGSTTADNINFVSSLEADATVPNISEGSNTVFVNVNNVSSNALKYKVETDLTNTPVIDYLDPVQGPVGQYVTIYGSKFGSYQPGKSAVKFHDIIQGIDKFADVSFPDACKSNWWNDSHIIVKVPAGISGNSQVFVINKDNKNSNPADFRVINGKPGPGLCAIVPHNGPVAQKIEASGDHYGASQAGGSAEFFKNSPAAVYKSWTNQMISTEVPSGAATGPFKIIDKDGTKSNSLPFMVGKCSSSKDCLSGEECCGGGNWDGICRASGTCGDGSAAGCTYGWSFSTSAGTTTPATCGGYTEANACMAAGSCPNSPGECKTSTTNVVGKCGDDECNAENPKCNGKCAYDKTINKCKLTGAGSSCQDNATSTKLGYEAVCSNVKGEGIWQIKTKSTCPLGSFKDLNGFCTVGTPGAAESCDVCSSGFSCEAGQCVINKTVCPTNSSCVDDQCVSGKASCECCCNIEENNPTTKNNPGCCTGLTCGKTCGSDTIDDGAGFGKCMGCRVNLDGNMSNTSAAEQSASDKACNCTGGSTRYCQIDESDPSDIGTCEDKQPIGANCSSIPGTCSPDNNICSTNNCQSDCTCGPATTTPSGKPCDGNTANSQCDADNALCDAGQVCDASSCQCKPNVSAGEICKNEAASCTTGADSCGLDYSCLSDSASSCRCCCDPGDGTTPPQVNSAGLVCQPNKEPCSGGSRGLYCGCSSDGQCGNGLDGCGLDTCCSPRPEVVSVEPSENSTGICRNPLIRVTFNQQMDISSFSGNVILVGDYGTDQCPANTTYLATIDNRQNNSKIKRFFSWFRNIFAGNRAMALPGNYCAVTGTVSGVNQPSGADTQGVLLFSPSQVLDANKKYYVIAKGDASSTDSFAEGIKNKNNIGLNNLTLSAEEFNSLKYYGKIWSFTTKPKTAADDGICRLDSVKVSPDNYLFKTDKNDNADDSFGTANFDSIVDNDKAFTAYALAKGGQNITSVPGTYEWQWSWQSENGTIAKIAATANPAISVVSGQNKKDAKTVIRANAKITIDKINKPSTVNIAKTGKATVRIFLCSNPWPPVVDPTKWPWRDENSNCSAGLTGSSCVNNNFEFYYCRDNGATGIDDLPSINNEAPVIRGEYDQLLKEFFFLRSTKPGVNSMIALDQLTGGRVFLSWAPVSGASGYKIYYGLAAGSYTETAETQTNSIFINNLSNNKKYYFAYKSYNANNVESDLSKEVSVIPTDQTPPAAPTDISAVSSNISLTVSWKTGADAVKYKVYYGTSSGTYGNAIDVSKADVLKINGLTKGARYYITVTAIDASGNESAKAQEINAVF